MIPALPSRRQRSPASPVHRGPTTLLNHHSLATHSLQFARISAEDPPCRNMQHLHHPVLLLLGTQGRLPVTRKGRGCHDTILRPCPVAAGTYKWFELRKFLGPSTVDSMSADPDARLHGTSLACQAAKRRTSPTQMSIFLKPLILNTSVPLSTLAPAVEHGLCGCGRISPHSAACHGIRAACCHAIVAPVDSAKRA
ncbi:hypothetical protein N657DRAFT_157922 [Parathielavia appendiculata]|uniref:Uncharacterized protein n=1 Tax=Parathielavia appendiculata TaxID=2587402 RepID=A0AAN6TTW2_9PEZI|nr:hypothetical protein N657DRAFT_157922 [Parathielavia appendiculata]